MIYTLTNSFHRTEINIRVSEMPEYQSWAWHEINEAAYRELYYPPFKRGPACAKRDRIWRKLCGISGCCCGTVRK